MLGRKVRHPTYGTGTVVSVEGDDEDRRVSVSFPGRGTKKFIERYAQLVLGCGFVGVVASLSVAGYIEARLALEPRRVN